MLSRSIMCLATCVLSGCMHTGGAYPPNWAGRAEAGPGECPVIDGEYQNAGEMFYMAHADTPASLALLLAGWADPEHRRLDYTEADPAADPYRGVSLRLADGNLHVVAARVDGGADAFDLPVRAKCADSLVALEPSWSANSMMAISTIVDRSTLELGRATDGSLLVHVKSRVGLLLFYVPAFGGTDKRWIRFPPDETARAPGIVATTAGT